MFLVLPIFCPYGTWLKIRASRFVIEFQNVGKKSPDTPNQAKARLRSMRPTLGGLLRHPKRVAKDGAYQVRHQVKIDEARAASHEQVAVMPVRTYCSYGRAFQNPLREIHFVLDDKGPTFSLQRKLSIRSYKIGVTLH